MKAVTLTVTSHLGDENAQNHEDYMDDLETAFSVNDIDEIITMNEKDWYDYSAKQENAVKVAVMQKVMIAILQSTLKKGMASTAYKDFKRERKKDARGMYLAVRDAYHKTNSTLTRKDLKGQLGVMKWGPESQLDQFYLKFMTIVKLLGALKDIHGKTKPIDQEDQAERFQKYFTDSQSEMPPSEQSWKLAFESADMMCARTNTELSMAELKSMISTRLDSGMEVEADGRVSQHTGKKTQFGECHNCGSKDHYIANCPAALLCAKCGKKGHTANHCRGGRSKEDHQQFNEFMEWKKQQSASRDEAGSLSKDGKSNKQLATSPVDSVVKYNDQAPWWTEVPDTGIRSGTSAADSREMSGICKRQQALQAESEHYILKWNLKCQDENERKRMVRESERVGP